MITFEIPLELVHYLREAVVNARETAQGFDDFLEYNQLVILIDDTIRNHEHDERTK